MRCLAAQSLLLVAACSGGSGASPAVGFTPSPQIAATHPFLMGIWRGTMNDSDGTSRSLTARVMGWSHPHFFHVDADVQGFGDVPGWIQADRDQWIARLHSSVMGTVEFEGVIVGEDRLTGTWLGGQPAGALEGHAGTVVLNKSPIDVIWTQEVYESEGVTVIVEQHFGELRSTERREVVRAVASR